MNATVLQLPFFTNLLILLVAARILGELMARFRQPAMLGEILAGILLGPSVLGIMDRTEEIKVISDLGIFLLVILAGLEINIDDILRSIKGRNILTSLMALALPLTGGWLVGQVFGLDASSGLLIGLCMAITALPVGIRMLQDMGRLNTPLGQRLISVAIFDDVLALSLLGIILSLQNTDMSVAAISRAGIASLLKLLALLGILGGAYFLLRRIIQKGNYLEDYLNKLLLILRGKEPLFGIFFAFILLFSTLTEGLGLHFIVGTFFAALLINETVVGPVHFKSIEKTTGNMAMGFLAPVFFAGIGLEFEIRAISNLNLLATVLLASVATKFAGGYFGGLLAGMNHRDSVVLGVGLNARGIMEIVVANTAYAGGLINTEVFSILILMSGVAMIATPIALKRAFSWNDNAMTPSKRGEPTHEQAIHINR